MVGLKGRGHGHRARGFTYLALLLAVALAGVALLVGTEVWVTNARRAQARQLDWVARQYVQALRSYRQAAPVERYPSTLADLLEDRRFEPPRRHLRQLYPNPFTGRADWEPLLGGDGRLRGLRGLRARIPGAADGVEPQWVLITADPAPPAAAAPPAHSPR
ncbi:type II secretion system protein [Aquincola sp. S2]|uniref:Type II secretion system protein n=1 Tax=Pseudaquabacterium terrae TaxID=2732868 RepID=A0ABX2EJR6_9BURK|nr:type II secretion system protein [Aquabacterium terrae]NRF68884.1 type II secretion system protein [Aquabacterium terrae]